jgi:hypothetical protein
MPSQLDIERRTAHVTHRHGVYVLWLLREKQCQTFRDLLDHFKSCGYESLVAEFVRKTLRHLIQYDLVEIRDGADRIGNKPAMYQHLEREPHSGMPTITTDEEGKERTHNYVYHVTPEWAQLSSGLGISLSRIASIVPGKSEIVAPFFHDTPTKAKDEVFVAMPFSPEEMKAIYEDRIRMTALKVGLTCARGDDFFSQHAIIDDIWHSIKHAKCVVADCTGQNANVFYEIGIAHTVGVPTILITQDKGKMPFNLLHVRRIEYSTDEAGLKELERTLELALRDVVAANHKA